MRDPHQDAEAAGVDVSQGSEAVAFVPEARRSDGGDLAAVGNWLVTTNPFYAISAALVFLGLRVSFDTSGANLESTALLTGLATYTLLLAVTAVLLIRLGQVWDDARSLLLIVVMMLVGISFTFDEALARDASRGWVYYVVGLAVAATVAELLMRGTGMRLGIWFRLPYHAVMGVLFLYPVALSGLVGRPEGAALSWGMWGFSVVAGAALLLLVPAIHRGAAYVADNGTPWRWPWFPWTVFGLLGGCVAVRAALLCTSLHFVGGGATVFGGYFLIPLVLVLGVLLVEAGAAHGSRGLRRAGVLVPWLAVGLAIWHRPFDPLYVKFLMTFTSTICAPLYGTAVVLVLYFAYAAMRGAQDARGAVCTALCLLAVTDPVEFEFSRSVEVSTWPLAVVGAIQLFEAVRRGSSARAAMVLVGAVAITMREFEGSSLAAYRGVLGIHLGAIALLAVGTVFQDRLATILRIGGAVAVVIAAVFAISGTTELFRHASVEARAGYVVVVALAGVAYGYLFAEWSYFAAAGANGMLLAGWMTAGWYRSARAVMEGLDLLAVGALSFAAAVLLSLLKFGGRLPGERTADAAAVGEVDRGGG